MCLSIPAQILYLEGDHATVSIGGIEVSANVSLIEDVQKGDYILVHSGFALEKIDEEEARKTLEVFKAYEDFNEMLDQEEGRSKQ